jgi:hypothetical protein
MGAISFSVGFFGHGAAQPNAVEAAEDKMEQAILDCERKDATAIRKTLHNLVGYFTKPEGRLDDSLESAILACKRRDAAIVRNLLLNGS